MRITVKICLLMACGICACHQREPGPFERAGERTDEIIDNIEEGKPLLHKKGPLEKAGEAVDESIDGKKRRH